MTVISLKGTLSEVAAVTCPRVSYPSPRVPTFSSWVCEYLLMVTGCGRQLGEVSGGKWNRALVAEAVLKYTAYQAPDPLWWGALWPWRETQPSSLGVSMQVCCTPSFEKL